MTELLETLGIRDRSGIEAFIERLIDMLDEFEPDPDLEPELGWNGYWTRKGDDDHGGTDDREIENEHGGDINDEPEWDDGYYGI